MLPDLVARGLVLRSVDEKKRAVDFIASTDAIDSYDEVVEQDWILDRYLSNPVILFGHNSRELPIGKATRCEVVTNNGRAQLECTVQFLSEKANPVAEQVWQSVLEGGLRAVSVGFMPGDYRFEKRNGVEVFVLSKNTLHEISVVPIPANPEALAKMKQRARGESSSPGGAQEKDTMKTAEELTKDLARAEAEKAISEKSLVDIRGELASTKSALTVAESTITTLTVDRDAHKERADAAEKAGFEAEVDKLVGVKIYPSEKEDFVHLAQHDRARFERMVKARPEMKLTQGQVIKDDGNLPPVVDPAIGPSNGSGGSLSTKIFGS